jgi:hypothetical protein
MSPAYLFNWYPMPSQTALRREVVALEKLAMSVHRFSLRRYEMARFQSSADFMAAVADSSVHFFAADFPAWIVMYAFWNRYRA